MKSIIKLSLITLCLFFATEVAAQKGSGASVENRVNRLTEYLELDAEQKAAVANIFSKYQSQIKELRLKQTKGKTEDREAFRNILEEQDVALLNVLRDDQKMKYTNLRRGRGQTKNVEERDELKERAKRNSRKKEAKGKYSTQKKSKSNSDESGLMEIEDQ